jgi:hypothetical protein
MKRFIVFLTVFLLASSLVAQNPVTVKEIAGAWEAGGMTATDLYGMGLPKIGGTWYYVDMVSGNDAWDGLTVGTAVKSYATAYGKCTTGRGDGIVLISRTVSGTSYSDTATGRLTFAKYGITTIGWAATGYFGRARLTVSGDGDSLAAIMLLSGGNNTFININFANATDCETNTALRTAQRSAVQIGGARNKFINCHFNAYECNDAGTTTNTYAAYQSTGIELRSGSDENEFNHCYFGSSSYNVGNTASCWIYMLDESLAGQRFFKNCTFLQQVSAGTAFGAVESGGTTSMNGVDIYRGCTFDVWRANTHGNICASWFIGTVPNTGHINMLDCSSVGFSLLDSAGDNDFVYTNQPAGAASGGVGVSVY